ncbi:hypothetical protein [Rhodoplanes sp. SY1]|uniref:hypothetical protein n=1 Tax=Rhodoplanes sp. SY1 TaxID=3166646 RepID=UPI0038B5D9E6
MTSRSASSRSVSSRPMPSRFARPVSERRGRRLARELKALYVMRDHMRTRDIVWAVLAIPLLALVCLLVGAKLHWLTDHPLIGIGGALAAGAIIFAIGRRWLVLAALIVGGLLLILLEDMPDIGDLGSGGEDRKEARRRKLERAIAKREALLQTNGTLTL